MTFKENGLGYFVKKLSNYYWTVIDILAYKFERIADKYYKNSIGSEYEEEYRLLNISDGNKVIHIGCGAFPLSAIILVETTGATVLGIDKNRKKVEAANKLVRSKNLHHRIKIDHGDGVDYPVENFDTIIISGCVFPMLTTVDHVLEEAKHHCKIIIREMEFLVGPLVKYLDSRKDVALKRTLAHHTFPFFGRISWHTLYLVKQSKE
jgi:SAM-dependent methyltransferase